MNTLPKATEKEFAQMESYIGKIESDGLSEEETMEYLDFMNSYQWSAEFYEEDGKHGIKSVLGKIIVPAMYDDFRCSLVQIEDQEVVTAMKSGKWGLVATDGFGTPLTDFIYDYIAPVAGPLAIVSKDSLWGYLKLNGEPFTPVNLENIVVEEGELTFVNGISVFTNNGRYGVTNGTNISKAVFDELDTVEWDQYITGKREGRDGYINETGDFTEDIDEAWWAAKE